MRKYLVNMDLRTWLKSKGMTQRDFAAEVGLSESAVSHFIKGRIGPSRLVALEIERITGGAVSADSWDGGAHRMGQGAGVPKGGR